jgi:transcriptional regulator with XRE-family HTH domain
MDDDEEYLGELMRHAKTDWQYHEICQWLPYKPETIAEIAQSMASKGYRPDRPIIVFEGRILDGRHRYEAAIKANVDPLFVEFHGSREEAIDYVTSENVARRHLNNTEKEFFYAQRAEALGVQSRGGDRKSEINVTNVTMVPSQEDHAEALGVARETVNRWENTRKEIMSDPELAEKAKTPSGYKAAKQEVKRRKVARKIVVPDYDVGTTFGALKGMAEMFGKRYEGTHEDAASILFSELIKGCEQDDIGMSIARDYVKWFLSFKEVLDMAQPSLEAFLEDKPNLKLVN